MAGPKVTIISSILEEHQEELDFLWARRQATLRSPRDTLRELVALEERIEAHVQGLLVGADQTVALLEPGLVGEERRPAFVAGYVLGRMDRADLSDRVLATFLRAKGPQLAGLCEALCQLPVAPVLPRLRQALAGTPAAPPLEVQVALAEVLGFHAKLEIKTTQMDGFLKHENPAIRRAGWRAAAFLLVPRPAESYQAGLQDPDPSVRRAALLAAAWGRQAWLAGYLRQLAARPAPEHAGALLLYAVLAKSTEIGYLVPLGKATQLGPERYRILGATGHPAVVDLLLAGIESSDPATAAAAAAAFSKITGADIDSGRRTVVPPADGHEPDEFEREFLDEVPVPSPERARAHWQKVKDPYARRTRMCRGMDVSHGARDETLVRLDLESRWEACLRGKMDNTWTGGPASLEAFPYKGPPPREPRKPGTAAETMLASTRP